MYFCYKFGIILADTILVYNENMIGETAYTHTNKRFEEQQSDNQINHNCIAFP